MSEENVEIVRRLVDAWNRRDLEALVDLGDPEVSFVNSPTAVEPGTRRGMDEVAAAIRQQWEVLDAQWEVDQVFDRATRSSFWVASLRACRKVMREWQSRFSFPTDSAMGR